METAVATYEPSIDELIAQSLLPRVPWPSRRTKGTITVTDYNGLQAAIDAAHGGDIIRLVGKKFAGFKIKKAWGFKLTESWIPPDRSVQVVCIVNGNPDGTQPIIEGFAVWQMNNGTELWCVDLGIKPAEWQEENNDGALEWVSGPYCFGGPITGMPGSLRFKNCTLYDAEKSKSYGGSGLKAGCRTTRMGLHFEGCRSADGAIAQEQWIYPDNCAFFIQDGCDWGPCGRSHYQTGTRNFYQMPDRFLGILVQNSKFRDGFCGSANAGSNTVYGYPGLVVMRNNLIQSNGWDGLVWDPELKKMVQKHIDPTAGVVVWRAYNEGGAKLDADGFATSILVIDNVKVSIGPGGLDACTFEWINRAHIRGLDTTGSANGAHHVNNPGQYNTHGIANLRLYGPPFPPIRTHIGDSTSKQWHTWTQEELLAATKVSA